MGRCTYYTIGFGMTESEARKDAINSDKEENGHQDGYTGGISSSTYENDKVKCLVKPKPAKTCTVDKPVQKGAKKWETVYKIAPKWGFSGVYETRKNVSVKTNQGDAIKKAKAMALEFNEEFEITITKELVGSDPSFPIGSNKIASISPKKSTTGKWRFTGTARC